MLQVYVLNIKEYYITFKILNIIIFILANNIHSWMQIVLASAYFALVDIRRKVWGFLYSTGIIILKVCGKPRALATQDAKYTT